MLEAFAAAAVIGDGKITHPAVHHVADNVDASACYSVQRLRTRYRRQLISFFQVLTT